MNSNNLSEQILQLHNQGLSIRNIAQQLEISKSHVHRVVSGQIEKHKKKTGTVSQEECPKINETNWDNQSDNIISKNSHKMEEIKNESFKEIELRKIELEHILHLRKLEMEENEFSLRRRELRLKEMEFASKNNAEEKALRELNFELKHLIEEELNLCDRFGNIEISMKSALRKNKINSKLFNKIKKHCSIYDVTTDNFELGKELSKINERITTELNAIYVDEDYENDDEDWTVSYRIDYSSQIKIKQLLSEI